MHIQHNEWTSGHTGNISTAPRPHNTKLTFDTLTVDLMCRIPHRPSGEWKTRAVHFTFYFTCSPEHKIFLFFTGLNNEDINIFRMASLQKHFK